MIKVEGLTKRYDGVLAVDNISFEIKKGEVIGFLGPNGAGKTTTMRILTCFMPPTSGRASVAGYDIGWESLEIRKRIGYLPEYNPLYEEMGTIEYLEFIGHLRGFKGQGLQRRLREVIDICGLGEVLSKDIGQLSRGYRQRTGLAQAIFHNPEILILDEPTSGLDPNQTREIRQLLQQLKGEKTVILSTHLLPEAQAVADRLLIINQGKIVADATQEVLAGAAAGKERLSIKLEAPEQEAIALLPGIEGVENVRIREREEENIIGYEIEAKKGIDIRKSLFQFALNKGWSILEIQREKTSLEEIFRQLTLEKEPQIKGLGK